MSAAPQNANLRIPDAFIKKYAALVVPLWPATYHVLRGSTVWQAQKWPDGRVKLLDTYALRRHLDPLDPNYIVSARWPSVGKVKVAALDLDSPLKHVPLEKQCEGPELIALADEEMRLNLLDVLAALGYPPHLTVRSSMSRGLHLYFFLDRFYDAKEVHDVIVERLQASGIAPGDGVVDKVFPANQALRLPLGTGSCILDDRDLISHYRAMSNQPRPRKLPGFSHLTVGGPQAVVFPPMKALGAIDAPVPIASATAASYKLLGLKLPLGPTSPVVNLGASLAVIESHAKNPVALVDLRARSVGARSGGVVVKGARPAMAAGSASTNTQAPSATAGAPNCARSLTALLQRPAQKGKRFAQRKAIVLALYRSGVSKAVALPQIEAWLNLSAKVGTSEDLRAASAQKIAGFLQDAESFWNYLVQKGVRPVPIRTASQRRVVALSTIAGIVPRSFTAGQSVPSSTSTPPSPTWNRGTALSALRPCDHAKLTQIASDWLRNKAMALVGLIRVAEGQIGSVSEVTIAACVLDRVLGGRRPPEATRRMYMDRTTRRPRHIREVLLSELERLGYLHRVDHGIRHTRGSLFLVTLP